MLELNARPFLGAITELRAVQMLLANMPDRNGVVAGDDLSLIRLHVSRLVEAVEAIGSRAAMKSAERLQLALASDPVLITFESTRTTLADIESRFADHLDDVLFFVIPDQQVSLFGEASELMGSPDILFMFPSATFELEEAAKCLAFGRPTASVFHSMRLIEIGIAALAKHLGVENPTRANDRSWGVILGKIKTALDVNFPKQSRLPSTDGAELEGIYATLDAIKGPWRNGTMHVETIYTESDAQHILNCTIVFLRKLMERCDEDGSPLVTPMGL